MNILCIGDIVSKSGREVLSRRLDWIKTEYRVELTIANGENAAHGRGITRNIYEELCEIGIDGFTMGNHTWGCKDVVPLLLHRGNIIRPLNFSGDTPGQGSMLLKAGNGRLVGVINLIGRTYMDPAESPFLAARREIERLKKKTNIILVDFHAEATSEKIAMGLYLDGSVSAVFGTHTHVQTADETILPKGTGYMTDLGMTGPVHSVLGMEAGVVIDRFLNGMPARFQVAESAGRICGCLFTIDEESGVCMAVRRILEE